MDLKGTAAIVTGGSGALGGRICRGLAQRGVDVAVIYASNKDTAEKNASELRELGVRAVTVGCDLSQPDQIKQMVNRTMKEFGRIDILVNNAVSYYGLFVHNLELDMDNLDQWNHSIAVNITAPVLCMRAVAPIMKTQGQGRIVNITSVGAYEAVPFSLPYAIGRSTLTFMTKPMAVTLAPEILVNCVAPGFMLGTQATNMLPEEYHTSVQQNSLLKRPVDKDDVAKQVVEFCQTESIIGQTVVIDAGRYFH